MGDESHPKTLYVGNFDESVTEDFLYALFGQIGEVKGCKIIREPGNDPYAFLEFTNHTAAAKALAVLNKRVFLEKEMKVNWATSPGLQNMGDESHPKTLYVGNLDAGVTEDFLYALFGQIGEVKGCKIIREPGNDPYAFLEFTNHTAAAKALAVLNKRVFLEKEMKVNWATSPGLYTT